MTIQDIMRANEKAGRHFFSPQTMRFFKSRVHWEVYEGPGGVYFVTSERIWEHESREYKVRKFDPETGHVVEPETDKYELYDSRGKAHRRAQQLAEGRA